LWISIFTLFSFFDFDKIKFKLSIILYGAKVLKYCSK
jgi:hypothetical protein